MKKNEGCTNFSVPKSRPEIEKMKPSAVIISPGPSRPEKAGICIELVKKLYNKIPILGVCLGHQAVGQAFGGNIIIAPEIMHGKLSEIHHNNHRLFDGIDIKFNAVRYHSLIIKNESIPNEINIIAKTSDNIIMAIAHKKYKTYGVQFHPESIGTDIGKKLFKNFIELIND